MMNYAQVLTTLLIAALAASQAEAQYGLYDPPDVADFSYQYPAPPLGSYAFDSAYDATPTPAPARSPRVRAEPLNPPPPPINPPAPEREPVAGPSVVDEMLSESAGGGHGPSMGEYPLDASCGSCGTGPFGEAVASGGFCDPCLVPEWQVSVSALYMTRDDPNPLSTTMEAGSPADGLGTYVPMDWSGGGEVRILHRFGCIPYLSNGCSGGWAVEGVFWTLDSLTGSVTRRSSSPGGLVSSTLDFTDVSYRRSGLSALDPGDLFYDARRQRVSRHDDVYNVELNLIRSPSIPCAFGPLEMSWSVGARLFQFDEDWRYVSLADGGMDFGINPDMEGYLDNNISNMLIGAQVGADVAYQVDKWGLFFRPRVGLYNNHIKNHFAAYRGDGAPFAADTAGYPDYPVTSSTNAVSFLTEVDAGLEWLFSPRWGVHLGYRATVVTGIGLADHQIPHLVVDTPAIADIDHNAHLILHGGYAGVSCQF